MLAMCVSKSKGCVCMCNQWTNFGLSVCLMLIRRLKTRSVLSIMPLFFGLGTLSHSKFINGIKGLLCILYDLYQEYCEPTVFTLLLALTIAHSRNIT